MIDSDKDLAKAIILLKKQIRNQYISDPDEAIRSACLSENTSDHTMLLCRILQDWGDGYRALALAEETYRANPKSQDIQRRIDWLLSNYHQANQPVGRVLIENQTSPEIRRMFVHADEISFDRSRRPEEISLYEDILKLDPGNVFACQKLTERLVKQREYPRALRALNTTLRKVGVVPRLVGLKAHVLTVGYQQTNQAISVLERAIAKTTHPIILEYQLLRVALVHGDFDLAIQTSVSILEHKPTYTDAVYIAGFAAIKNGDFPLAIRYFTQLCETAHFNLAASAALGSIAIHINQPRFAEQYFNELLQHYPDHPLTAMGQAVLGLRSSSRHEHLKDLIRTNLQKSLTTKYGNLVVEQALFLAQVSGLFKLNELKQLFQIRVDHRPLTRKFAPVLPGNTARQPKVQPVKEISNDPVQEMAQREVGMRTSGIFAIIGALAPANQTAARVTGSLTSSHNSRNRIRESLN